MASFKVCFKPSLHKDLRRLSPPVIHRVLLKIEGLQSDPFPAQSLKLSGADRLYRLRVGDYRVVDEVDMTAQEVTVQHVRHRREVYRNL